MVSGMKYRDIVREIALDQYGLVSTKQAVEAGVPAVELPKLAARGGLVNVSYGLYRVIDIPPTVYDEFAEALMRVGDEAFLFGESVLAFFRLADVNPQRIRVATPRRNRARLPAFIDLVHAQDDVRTVYYEGLKAQPVVDAIVECRGRVADVRLLDAAKEAARDGLLTVSEANRVRREIQA